MKVCGSLSVQEQQLPREMSGKQQEGDGAGPGSLLGELQGKGKLEGGWGEPHSFQGQKMTTRAGLSLLFSLTEECKTVLILPRHPSTCQNLAELGHI